jgi:hypothetical protein
LTRRADQARNAKRLDEALALYRQTLKLKPAWDEGRFEAGPGAVGFGRCDGRRL